MIRLIKGNKQGRDDYLKLLKSRRTEVNSDVVKSVTKILNEIERRGDSALIEYTNKFDSKELNSQNILVTEDEIKDAYNKVDKKFIDSIKQAKKNIEKFHDKQKHNSFVLADEPGKIMGQRYIPLKRVGVYVPGGTAAYPSSVLMNITPAKIAGVDEIIMVTPVRENLDINPSVLVAADIAGADKIYKIGGAQAVAALAYGTETIPKVDKIVGPGNIYVATSKKLVYGEVDIDMIAGPSEILVIADETANPKFVAADLMSQAEHDKLASSALITTSFDIAEKVNKQIEIQIKDLDRKEIIEESLKNNGIIILVDNIKEAFEIGNEIAPEHLELCIKDPFSYLPCVRNAGSVFLGSYSPEPLGDYFAGPNHVLPTSGTARFYSPLSVDDFVKKSSYIYYSKEELQKVADNIMTIAEDEGLTAHRNSIYVRKN
ncbi:histidinol dehydrogenase [Clostridium tyrobutyricum]|uniref:histidinol dehydrogenase n=1 Tax=Clostridium tyrobutyricum TaxID=1519 RepID=UPI001C3938D8|nr:histidinol dehydrogenase [Clostridium tyrobutyricum]MBV4415176.1 histidinol dehydrogenase [Clostridium tyrobutyricum]MBV4420847.1 histidinol dehydrogenase [Clostridium tyrobutyricum]MBV4426833.1 histidinol dehydrogenase [Clostridium tyrobutyricum]MBV4441989.1 histidinol dehydrogenase [Clostridium tyrobutyricum]MBV4445197.1 histidinol dehydrogenase [Clostridium tyrobutyricum]